MMKVLGIDQSMTSTAWVIIDGISGDIDTMGVIKTNKKNKDVEISKERRFLSISEELLHIIETHAPSHIGIEGLSLNSNSNTTRDLAGLYYVIITRFLDEGLSYETFPPKSVKAFAAHGRADKNEMLDAIPDKEREKILKSGYKKTTGLFDLADAYHIAQMARKSLFNRQRSQ